ncbi:MAG TPA: hypothetical protein PLD79_09890, partial [Halothiobacillus sp.]|nr:hypothetical protein [Halothiobacillus sp.]
AACGLGGVKAGGTSNVAARLAGLSDEIKGILEQPLNALALRTNPTTTVNFGRGIEKTSWDIAETRR